jgi:hypothetical protein
MGRAEASGGRVCVFAKAPVPGVVKTRLIPAMGAESAAMLHRALVERALRTALQSGAAVELTCAPDASHPFFAECRRAFGVALAVQGTGDLGERMARTLRRALAEVGTAVIVGADAPSIDVQALNAAFRALGEADVVLAPAEDGGYVLIGAARVAPRMFAGIEWGASDVLQRQRAALAACGLRVRELPTLWDVDRPDDLARIKELEPPLEFSWR